MSAKAMPWFRLYAEIVDDEKLRLLAFEDRWHYVALLALKCDGLLDKDEGRELLHRKVAVKLGLQLRDLEAMALRLDEVGLIDAETFQPVGWDGRQFMSDADPTAAERKRRQRERNKQENQQDNGVTDESRVTVTEVTRTDTDTDTEKKKHIAQRCASRFDEFWLAYPKRVGRKPSLEKWKAKKLDEVAETIIADVRNRQANDGRWLEGFIPDPRTYLVQERWNDELQPRRELSKSPIASQAPSAGSPSPVKPEPSRLDKELAWIVHQRDWLQTITPEEAERLSAEARDKYRDEVPA